MLDLCGCYTQEWSDKTGRDSAGLLLQQTFDYSEDPLKPRASLITDQTVTVLSLHPQAEGSINMPSIWIENPPLWQENNSPSCWSRGSSFSFLNTRKLPGAKLFLSAGGEEGHHLLVWFSGRNGKKTYSANDNERMNWCRKSQQIASPDGIFPKHGTLISCSRLGMRSLKEER